MSFEKLYMSLVTINLVIVEMRDGVSSYNSILLFSFKNYYNRTYHDANNKQ